MTTAIATPGQTRPRPEYQYTHLPMKSFSIEEYHRMIDNGSVTTSNRMELLHGLLVYKKPQNFPHSTSSRKAEKRLKEMLGHLWEMNVGKPVSFPDEGSELEPDIAIIRGPEDRYLERHPLPEDVVFIVEVSNSSLSYDQGDKLETYARSGIPVYWIVNLIDRQIEVYTKPVRGEKPSYSEKTIFKPGEEVPVVLDGQKRGTIAVSEVIP